MRVKVNIEERLVKIIEVNVDAEDTDKAITMAENYVMDKYARDEIKLNIEDNLTGISLIMSETDNGISTDWHAAFTPDKDDIPSDNLVKLIGYNLIKLLVIHEKELPNKTIVLPIKVYQKYVENKDTFFIIKYPVTSIDNMLKLSDINIEPSSSKEDCCYVSTDILTQMQLDFKDIVCCYYGDQ